MYDRYKLLDNTRKNSLIKEIRILRKLDHPGVVKMIECIDTVQYVYLVMELI